MEPSFLNIGYLRYLMYYLLKQDSDTDPEAYKKRSSAFYGALMSLRESIVNHQSIERLNLLTDLIARSEFVHVGHYGDFARLHTELPGLTDADVYRLYAVMFGIFRSEIISYPVWDLLMEHFAELALRVARKTNVSLVFKEAADAKRFEDALCEALAEFALWESPLKDVAVWGENYPPEPREPVTVRDGTLDDDLEDLSCYVELTDAETLSRMKNAAYLPAFSTGEPDRCVMLVGSMITFALPDLSDAVTVQITGRADYGTYAEMYKDLGTEVFGYGDRSPAECAAKTEKLFADCMSHGPLCLKVKRLSMPILNVSDLETLRKKGKGELYYDRYRADDYVHAQWEPTLITDCCSLEVGNYYNYCPSCGKRIDIIHCKRGKTLLGGFEERMFDYATWICSCGRGYERLQYGYCPICGKNREETEASE